MALSVQEILDLDIPSPTWSLRPSIAAPIRSDMTFSRPDVDNPDPTARAYNPASGKFEGVGADTPRIQGGQQGFLYEAAQRTNQVPYSANFNQWGTPQGGDTLVESIFTEYGETTNAKEGSGDGSAGYADMSRAGGSFSGGKEAAQFIIEKGTADQSGVGIFNNNNSGHICIIEYDWTKEIPNRATFDTTLETAKYVKSQKIADQGPNGGEVVQVYFAYDGNHVNNVQGDPRELRVYVDRNVNGNSTIGHYGGVQERGTHTSPIVTGGSAVTRGADQASIFDYRSKTAQNPDWYGTNEITFLVEYKHLTWFDDVTENSIRILSLIESGVGVNNLIVFNGWKSSDGFRVSLEVGQIRTDSAVVRSFGTNRVAFSLRPDRAAIAGNGNGEARSNDYSSANILNADRMQLGKWGSNRFVGEFYTVQHIPEFLPLDTLKTLTA